MPKIISICIAVQLLFLTSRVESQTRARVITAADVEFTPVAIIQRYPGQNLCGGTLITKQHIITATYCIEKENYRKLRVILKPTYPEEVSVTYTIDSWMTYNTWARRRNIQAIRVGQDIAILKLVGIVYTGNVKPVRLSELNKKQVQGKKAIMTGWFGGGMDILKETNVKILSDEECSRHVELLTNILYSVDLQFLCTVAEPYVLLDCRDSGAPLLDRNNQLLGVNFDNCPDSKLQWGNFSEELARKYRVNMHSNIDFYRDFIVNFTDYQ